MRREVSHTKACNNRVAVERKTSVLMISNFDFHYFAPCNERRELCECSLACSRNKYDNSVVMLFAENTRDTQNVLNCKIEELRLFRLYSARKIIVNKAIVYVISCFFI